MLGTLAGDDSSYSARREVWLALAGASLDRGDWPGAHRLYREIDRDWTAHRDLLGRLAASGDTDSLWRSWEEHSPLSSPLMLDAAPASRLADALEKASVDGEIRFFLCAKRVLSEWGPYSKPVFSHLTLKLMVDAWESTASLFKSLQKFG